jgi:hypothetical protein
MKEALSSSETSVITRATRRNGAVFSIQFCTKNAPYMSPSTVGECWLGPRPSERWTALTAGEVSLTLSRTSQVFQFAKGELLHLRRLLCSAIWRALKSTRKAVGIPISRERREIPQRWCDLLHYAPTQYTANTMASDTRPNTNHWTLLMKRARAFICYLMVHDDVRQMASDYGSAVFHPPARSYREGIRK